MCSIQGAEKQRNSIETSLKTTEKKMAEIEKEKTAIQKDKSELQMELKVWLKFWYILYNQK